MHTVARAATPVGKTGAVRESWLALPIEHHGDRYEDERRERRTGSATPRTTGPRRTRSGPKGQCQGRQARRDDARRERRAERTSEASLRDTWSRRRPTPSARPSERPAGPRSNAGKPTSRWRSSAASESSCDEAPAVRRRWLLARKLLQRLVPRALSALLQRRAGAERHTANTADGRAGPRRMKRPCLKCGALSEALRCPKHYRSATCDAPAGRPRAPRSPSGAPKSLAASGHRCRWVQDGDSAARRAPASPRTTSHGSSTPPPWTPRDGIALCGPHHAKQSDRRTRRNALRVAHFPTGDPGDDGAA